MTIRERPANRVWIWGLWAVIFYAGWIFLVFGLGFWPLALEHWPIAITMALGSFVAGSTPMGGGTVGFPVLVLLFEQPATLGRDFSFAVQSVGMTSASIFILSRRQPLAWAVLKGALVGALAGLPLGICFLSPIVSELWIKLIFAVIWAGFGLLHLLRNKEITAHEGMTEFDERWDFRVGLMVGFVAGATVVAITGVGIDMVLYALLVLVFRADLKIAIPTSVVIMAFCSLLGVGVKALTGGLQPGVFGNWLAAAPVVCLGAPLGAFVVHSVDRKPILIFVAVLCLLQFVWTCYSERERLGLVGFVLSLGGAIGCLLVFEWFRRIGRWVAGETKAVR